MQTKEKKYNLPANCLIAVECPRCGGYSERVQGEHQEFQCRSCRKKFNLEVKAIYEVLGNGS